MGLNRYNSSLMEGKERRRMKEPRRRRKLQRSYLSSTLALCRDLERRELWDVTAIQSLSKFFSNLFKEGWAPKDTSERILQAVVQRLEDGVACGKHLLAGALSAAVCKTVVAPVERVRMDIVLSNTAHAPLGACAEILRTEGVFGFWRGNVLNIVRTAPFKAVNFFAFDVYCKVITGVTERSELRDVERFGAGAMAGVTAFLTCLPLDTVRTRLLSFRTGHQYNGIFHAFGRIVRTEGFPALYKGCIPGIMSIAPGSAVFYGVYGTLKQAYVNRERLNSGTEESGLSASGDVVLFVLEDQPKTSSGMELPILHSLLYGAIAGMCAEAVVYPLEVIRRQVQLQMETGMVGIANSAVARNGVESSLRSFSSACSTIVRTQGVGGFYAGCLLNTAQVLPSAALSYFAYEAFKTLLNVEPKKDSNRTN